MWLRKLLVDLFGEKLEPTVIHFDNQSYMKLSKNPLFHDRSKHIEMKYHFIKDMVHKGAMRFQYTCRDEQIADVLTNPLSLTKFVYFRESLVLQRMPLSLRSVDF